MSEEENLISIKELASKLKSSDALLKKIVKDFGIETQSVKNRLHLNDDSVKTVREVLALRASGKKNKEIKEMFDASKEVQEKSPAKTEAKAENKEETSDKKKTAKKTDAKKESPKAKKPGKKTSKKAEAEELENTDENPAEEDENPEEAKTEEKTNSKSKKTSKKPNSRNDSKSRRDSNKKDSRKKEEDEGALTNIASYLDEDGELKLDKLIEDHDIETDVENVNIDDALDEDFDDEEIEEAEEIESNDGKLSPKKVKRRQFSYKYIQRQIANDSKRVNYLKQKIKRGRLSAKELMLLEDSLTKRYKLLSGWIHMLRWVKS